MPAEINYKNKYMELRSKYMNDMDMAFRLGFEQGQQQSQNDQMAQAQQQASEMEQAQAGAAPGEDGAEGAPAEGGAPGEEKPQDSMNPQGSELDQHIAKLESLLGKSEDPEIRKSLQNLVSIRKSELQAIQFKKSEQAIKGIAKALHKPKFKLGVQATHNMNSSAKSAVTLQHKIVNDVMAKMEEEQKRASKDIKDILNVEGLISKG